MSIVCFQENLQKIHLDPKTTQRPARQRSKVVKHLRRDYTNENACSMSVPPKEPESQQELFRCFTVKLQILILVAVFCCVFKCLSSSVVPQGYRFAVVTSLVKGGKGVCVASDGGHVVVAPHAST